MKAKLQDTRYNRASTVGRGGSNELALLKRTAQLFAHHISLIQRFNQDMSTLQLELRTACGGCGSDEKGLFAEFNEKLLCSQCFKNEIESRVKLVSE